MKAVVYDRYGPPEVLRIADVPVPKPRAGEVLVRVIATSVNLSDWEGLHGSPAYARFGGLFAPRHHILGSDIAGVVEAVGTDAEENAADRRGDEGDRVENSGAGQRQVELRVFDQRRHDHRIKHDVEGVEHPAERRGNERATGALVGGVPPVEHPAAPLGQSHSRLAHGLMLIGVTRPRPFFRIGNRGRDCIGRPQLV